MNLDFQNNQFVNVNSIPVSAKYDNRLKTGLDELDAIFGDGIVPGTVLTLTGTPGCGKTTFLLQLVSLLHAAGYRTAYASGEEAIDVLANTCRRLNVSNILISNETNIDTLVKATEYTDVLIVDSFTSLVSDCVNSRAHEIYCVTELCKAAKRNNCVIGIVLHISKSGKYKGSTIIPHSVDVSIALTRQLDVPEDGYSLINIDVTKNRFGALTKNVGVVTSSGYKWESPPVEVEDEVYYGY